MADDDGAPTASDGGDEFGDDYEFGDDDANDDDASLDEVDSDGDTGAGEGSAAAARKKRSVRNVPREPLEASVAHIDKMFDTFGEEAPQEALAVLLGHEAATGGSWKTRLGTLRAYGLLGPGDPVQLTEIGRDIVRTDRPSTQLVARRQALVASTPFRELYETYIGRPLPDEDGLATKCRFDFRLKQEGALEVARVFTSSLKFAGLVGPGDVVLPLDAEEPAEASEGDDHPDGHDEPEVDPDDTRHREGPRSSGEPGDRERSHLGGEVAEPPPATDMGSDRQADLTGEPTEEAAARAENPSLEVTVKLHGYSGLEVVQILRTIGYGDATDQ